MFVAYKRTGIVAGENTSVEIVSCAPHKQGALKRSRLKVSQGHKLYKFPISHVSATPVMSSL